VIWAIVVAAGSGTRFGAAKQFATLQGRSVAARAIDTSRAVCDGVVLVIPATQDLAGLPDDLQADRIVHGGDSRAASVRAGLEAVPDDAEVIVVHDAARPLASPALFEAAVAAVRAGAAGAICAVAVTDTIKRVDHAGRVLATLDRSELVAVQTPQAFDAAVLRRAHRSGAEATDDAALVELLGEAVVVVAGDPTNVKLTLPGDLARAENWLST